MSADSPVANKSPAEAKAAPAAAASASLHVGDLLPEVNEAALFEFFQASGKLVSARVCRHASTRRSLGYAYVNFETRADAETALADLNGSPIQGKPCRITWKMSDPSARKSKSANIFVKNLDPEIDNKDLADLFEHFGEILSTKVVTADDGASRGHGYVQFKRDEDALTAIAKLHGKDINGRVVSVAPFVSAKERRANADFTNVYFKNVAGAAAEAEVKALFEAVGEVTSFVLMAGRARKGAKKDDDAPTASRSGFVNFASPEDARKAVVEVNDADLYGVKLYVARHQKKTERKNELYMQFEQRKAETAGKIQGVNLFVKNIDEAVDTEKLRVMFKEFGEMTSVIVMTNETGASRGFGFVCFASAEDATRALSKMNGKMVNNKPLYVSLAQRKEDRRQHLESQYQQRQVATMGRMPMGQPGMFQQFQGFPGQAGPMGGRPAMMYGQGQGQGQMMPQQAWRQGMPQMQGFQGQQPGGKGAQGQQRGFKFNTNVRNQGTTKGGAPAQGQGQMNPQVAAMMQAGQQQQMMYQQQQQQQNGGQGQPPQAAQSLASGLANSAPAQQKQMLGERLFPLISQRDPARAPKITGMLLDLDNTELLLLLEDSAALEEKIAEARDVLLASSATA